MDGPTKATGFRRFVRSAGNCLIRMVTPFPLTSSLGQFCRLYPQFSRGSLNYVFIGGTALALHMAATGAKRYVSDIDILGMTPDLSAKFKFPYDLSGKRVQMYPVRTYKWLTVKPEDTKTLVIENNTFVVLKPEHLLLDKIGRFPIRDKDLRDAQWILQNMKLDGQYFNSIIKREGLDTLSLRALLSRKNDLGKLREYLEKVVMEKVEYDRPYPGIQLSSGRIIPRQVKGNFTGGRGGY